MVYNLHLLCHDDEEKEEEDDDDDDDEVLGQIDSDKIQVIDYANLYYFS